MANTKPYVVSEKKNLHVFILDWEDVDYDQYTTLSPHYQKNKNVFRLFSECFECQSNKVKFKRSDKPRDVLQYFQDAFKNLNDDDAIIIYYEGGAGDYDVDYEWQFEHGPKRPVEAYQLIQTFYDSGLHICLVLDAYMPTRFATRWKPRSDGKGCVEIMARGAPAQNCKGQVKKGDPSDFTDNMVKSLKTFVTKINVPKTKGGWLSRETEISVPQIMASNKSIISNPIRIFSRRPRAGNTIPIRRFVIDPDDVREDGKISMRMKIMDNEDHDETSDSSDSPALKTSDPSNNPAFEHEDEGFDEGAEESLFVPADEKKADPAASSGSASSPV